MFIQCFTYNCLSVNSNVCSNGKKLDVIFEQTMNLNKQILAFTHTCFSNFKSSQNLSTLYLIQKAKWCLFSSHLDYCYSLFTCLMGLFHDTVQAPLDLTDV